MLGPGRYNDYPLALRQRRPVCLVAYVISLLFKPNLQKPVSCVRSFSNTGAYMMVGDNLVYEPRMVRRGPDARAKRGLGVQDCAVDLQRSLWHI